MSRVDSFSPSVIFHGDDDEADGTSVSPIASSSSTAPMALQANEKRYRSLLRNQSVRSVFGVLTGSKVKVDRVLEEAYQRHVKERLNAEGEEATPSLLVRSSTVRHRSSSSMSAATTSALTPPRTHRTQSAIFMSEEVRRYARRSSIAKSPQGDNEDGLYVRDDETAYDDDVEDDDELQLIRPPRNQRAKSEILDVTLRALADTRRTSMSMVFVGEDDDEKKKKPKQPEEEEEEKEKEKEKSPQQAAHSIAAQIAGKKQKERAARRASARKVAEVEARPKSLATIGKQPSEADVLKARNYGRRMSLTHVVTATKNKGETVAMKIALLPLKENVRCVGIVVNELWVSDKRGTCLRYDIRTGDTIGEVHVYNSEGFEQPLFLNAIYYQRGEVWLGDMNGFIFCTNIRGQMLFASRAHSAAIRCLVGTHPRSLVPAGYDGPLPKWMRQQTVGGASSAVWSGGEDFKATEHHPLDGSVVRFLSARSYVRCMGIVYREEGKAQDDRLDINPDSEEDVSGLPSTVEIWTGSDHGIRIWNHRGKHVASLDPVQGKLVEEEAAMTTTIDKNKKHQRRKSKKGRGSPGVTALCVMGKHIWAAGNACITIWDAETRELVTKFKAHTQNITLMEAVGWGPDGPLEMWTATGVDGEISVWQAQAPYTHMGTIVLDKGSAVSIVNKGHRIWVATRSPGRLVLFNPWKGWQHAQDEGFQLVSDDPEDFDVDSFSHVCQVTMHSNT